MIGDMPRPRPIFLHRERTRHGKIVWYVQRPKSRRIRLRAEYGTEEFFEEYRAAMDGRAAPKKGAPVSGSVAWLIGLYRASSAFQGLRPSTQAQRNFVLMSMEKTAGDKPASAIREEDIIAGRERRQATPHAANTYIKTVRGLFKWAVKAKRLTRNPTLEVEKLKIEGDGHHVWTEEEVEAFEARWPLGTRERIAFDVLLYTGLRRGDAVRLGPQHVRNGIFRLKTEKTGIEIIAPILPALAASLSAGPTGSETFIAGVKGRPRTKEAFGTWFKEACVSAGVPGTAHGLRKAGATRAADSGATEAELEAIFGWTGGKMAAHYTKKANRAKLAARAMAGLEGEKNVETTIRTLEKGANADHNSPNEIN